MASSLALIKASHFTLGVMACAWGRFQSIFLHSMGLAPSTIGMLTSVGFILKSIGYVSWGVAMDWFDGSRYVLMASIIASSVALELYRRAVGSGVLLLMLITKGIRSLANAQYCLLDALTMRAVQSSDVDEDYGRQRFWGSLGYGLSSWAVGLVIDHSDYGTDFIFIHTYSTSFFFAALLAFSPFSLSRAKSARGVSRKSGLEHVKVEGGTSSKSEDGSPILGANVKSSSEEGVAESSVNSREESQALALRQNKFEEVSRREKKKPDRQRVKLILGNLKLFLASRALCVFLANLLAMYVLLCVFESVVWIHLERLHCPRSIVGLATTCQTIVEYPLFYYSKQILKRYTHRQLFLIAHASLLARLVLLVALGYTGFMLLILPIQLLHGLSFGVNWLASCEYVQHIAPPHITASAQSAISTTSVIASALGTYLWGVIYERYNSVSFFVATGVELMVFITILFLVPSLGLASTTSASAASESSGVEMVRVKRSGKQ
eukprot:jgi/Bigna1/87798/estExt_fgenesh1_pg.C_240133